MRHGAWKNGRPAKAEPVIVNNHLHSARQAEEQLQDEEVWLRTYIAVRGATATDVKLWNALGGDTCAETADNALKRFRARFR